MSRSYITRISLTILMVVIAGVPARAEPGFSLIGNGYTGLPYVVQGDIVLETNGLQEGVRDFSDLGNPEWLGWNDHSFTFRWSRVLSDGGLVIGINSEFGVGPIGFSVNDFRNPESVSELAVITGFPGESGWLRDGTFILCGTSIAITYDLVDPAEPLFASAILLGAHTGNRWPTAIGNLLFLVDEGSAIRVLDVTDPLHPADLGTRSPIAGRIDGMAAGGGFLHLLVANEGPGGATAVDLVTLDVGDPTTPVLTYRERLCLADDASGKAIVATDDLLLVSVTDLGVQAFSLANPAFPVPGWTLDHDTDHLQVSDSAIFINTGAELYVYERGSHDTAPLQRIHRTVVRGHRTMVGDGPVQILQPESDLSLLVPIDVSDPTQPRLGKPVDTDLTGTLFYGDGMGVMQRDDLDFQLMDLSDPRDPKMLGKISWPGPHSWLETLSGGVLAMTTHEKIPDRPSYFTIMLNLYDCRDPLQPTWVTSFNEVQLKVLSWPWMICGAENPIRVYRLDDDLMPSLDGHLETQFEQVLRGLVIGGCAYLFGLETDGGYGMEVHRLGPSFTLELRSDLGLDPLQADRLRDHLFVQGYQECLVYDVSNPLAPLSLGSFAKVGGVGFATNGDIATLSGQLVTVRCDGYPVASTPAPTLARGMRMDPARPNPFNPATDISFAIDKARTLTVGVYDTRGRLVRELVHGRFEAGNHAVTWDGRSGGAPAASGVYFVRIHGEGTEAVQSLTMIKLQLLPHRRFPEAVRQVLERGYSVKEIAEQESRPLDLPILNSFSVFEKSGSPSGTGIRTRTGKNDESVLPKISPIEMSEIGRQVHLRKICIPCSMEEADSLVAAEAKTTK